MSPVETLMAEIRTIRGIGYFRSFDTTEVFLLAEEIDRLEKDNRKLRSITTGLADRVAAQSHLLSRKAEKPLNPGVPVVEQAKASQLTVE